MVLQCRQSIFNICSRWAHSSIPIRLWIYRPDPFSLFRPVLTLTVCDIRKVLLQTVQFATEPFCNFRRTGHTVRAAGAFRRRAGCRSAQKRNRAVSPYRTAAHRPAEPARGQAAGKTDYSLFRFPVSAPDGSDALGAVFHRGILPVSLRSLTVSTSKGMNSSPQIPKSLTPVYMEKSATTGWSPTCLPRILGSRILRTRETMA